MSKLSDEVRGKKPADEGPTKGEGAEETDMGEEAASAAAEEIRAAMKADDAGALASAMRAFFEAVD